MSNKAILHGHSIILPEEYSTLAQMIVYISQKYPYKGMTYVDGKGKEDFVSYPELVEKARKNLKTLYKKGLKPGDVCILVIDTPKEFYPAFWACIFGGIIAAPVSQPTSWKPGSTGIYKLTKIWEVLDKPFVLTEELNRKSCQSLQNSPDYEEFRFMTTHEFDSDEMEDIYWTKPNDLVFLQFSSGSTGTPKGVKLTNKNIIYNNLAVAEGFGVEEDDTTFTWLPHTHDMGLFGQHLTPMCKGNNIMVFSPYTFVRSPYLFLQKITEHKGKWFCCTNFGFDWMVQKVPDEKLSTLDLSSLRVTINGAEPISVAVIKQFTEKFSTCGYKEEMMLPAYGMAEATVGVAISKITDVPKIERIDRSTMIKENYAIRVIEDEEDAVEYVQEGPPIGEISIRIADEQGNTLDEKMIGEIQVMGASVTSGYYNRDDLSEALFIDGWLKTGDLGFIMDGSLVVSGRIKDVIFVRGQNFFAHDLEEMVYQNKSIPRGNIAMVGLFNNKTQQEELLVFLRHKGTVEKLLPLREIIINRMQESLGIEVTHVIPVKIIPKTTSGKLQRFVLREGFENDDYDDVLKEIKISLEKSQENVRVIYSPQSSLEKFLCQKWSEILNVSEDRISMDDEFLALGGNSIKAYQLRDEMENYFGKEIGTEVLVICKTIRQMALYLESVPSLKEQSKNDTQYIHSKLDAKKAVAITGLALKLPNAKTKEEFWDNLCSQEDSISKISEKRKSLAGELQWDDWIGELENIDLFDNEFFEISDYEAKYMDPQQRLVLETSYEALEDAGLIPGSDEKRNIGVYSGISSNSYFHLLLNGIEQGKLDDIHPNAMVGNMNNIIAARLSHFYNFTGPSLAIDSACSSFLVALHHAVMAIRQNSVNGAVVAGANIMSTPSVHSLSRRAGIVSSTEKTKVFDRDADGSVLGEGVVVVYLEPLEKAVQENKNIYGVIRGTAVNNDGYSLSMMAPNPRGQFNVLKDAYSDAGISPSELGYMEAHGSGTAIGDPIEMNALSKLFSGHKRNTVHNIGIGSVKTNIGHLLPAAGGAGLAKVLLSLKNKTLVPSLHVENINPALELEKSPFYIVQNVEDWTVKEGETRKAGISSFGLGGTNVHVVLEEWREGSEVNNDQKTHLLTMSAKSEKSLEKIINQTEAMIENNPDLEIHNVCFTRNRYRKHYGYRAACLMSEGKVVKSVISKGKFLKNRSAKIGFMIGDLKNNSGLNEFLIEDESHPLFKNTLIEVSDLVFKHNIHDSLSFNRSGLLFFSYWVALLRTLEVYGTNHIEFSGIDSGRIFSDLLNKKIDLIASLEQFFETKIRDHDEQKSDLTNVDIVLSIGIPQETLMGKLPEDNVNKTKIVNLESVADISFHDKLLSVIKELYVAGADFDWESIYPDGSGRLIDLPPYPFDQKSFWLYSSLALINERR